MLNRIARPQIVLITGTLLAAIVAITHTFARLSYGVNFADEIYYLMLGLRFFNGARPFVDETNVT